MKKITTGLVAFLVALSIPVLAGQPSLFRDNGVETAAMRARPVTLEERQGIRTASRGGTDLAAVAASMDAESQDAELAEAPIAEENTPAIPEETENAQAAEPKATQVELKSEPKQAVENKPAEAASNKAVDPAPSEADTDTATEHETASTEVVEATDEKGNSLGSFVVTAYCDCKQCQGQWVGTTAVGAKPHAGTTIAVDPKKIALGTKVYIDGVGWRVAQDTGGAIKGNRIDLFMSSHDEALNWGRRTKEVWIEQ